MRMPLAYHAQALLRAAVILMLAVSSSPAVGQTFSASDLLFPALGDYWVYRLDGVQLVRLEVVEVVPAGAFTYVTGQWTGGPLDGLVTSGRFHPSIGFEALANFQPSIFVDGVGFVDQRQDFDPPILAAPPLITIGDIVQTSGTLVQKYSNAQGSVSIPGSYSATYRFALFEPIVVPFGSFQAIQRQIQLDIELSLQDGQTQAIRATSRDWLVPGLGTVRIEYTFPGSIDNYELVETNREAVPEPDLGRQMALACATLI